MTTACRMWDKVCLYHSSNLSPILHADIPQSGGLSLQCAAFHSIIYCGYADWLLLCSNMAWIPFMLREFSVLNQAAAPANCVSFLLSLFWRYRLPQMLQALPFSWCVELAFKMQGALFIDSVPLLHALRLFLLTVVFFQNLDCRTGSFSFQRLPS